MKKFVLQYLIMAYTIAYAGPPFGEALAVTNATQSSILAEWGLQYCLQYDKENLFKPIEKDKNFWVAQRCGSRQVGFAKIF